MPPIKTIKFPACVTYIFASAGSIICSWIDNLKTPSQTLICVTAHIHIPVYPTMAPAYPYAIGNCPTLNT